MTAILLSIIVFVAVATGVYFVQLKRRSKNELRKLNKQLLEEFEARKAAEENAKVLTKDNDRLKADIECKDKYVADLAGKLSERESSYRRNYEALGELQNKYRTLVETRDLLEAQLAQLLKEKVNSKKDYAYQMSLLSAHNNELATNCNKLQGELSDMRGELEEVILRFGEEKKDLLAATEKAIKEQSRLLTANDELSGKLIKLQADYEDGSRHNQVLEQELSEKKVLIESLHNRISTREAKIDEKEQEIENLKISNESLAATVRASQSIIGGHRIDIEKLEDDIIQLKNEKGIRDCAFKNLEADYELKKEAIKGLEEENISLKDKIDTRKEDINELNRQVEKIEKEKAALEARLRILEEQTPPGEPASPPEELPTKQGELPGVAVIVKTRSELKKKESRGEGKPRGTPVTIHTQEKTLNHHLLCWKAYGAWSVGLELLSLADELVIDKVIQKEITLDQDDSRENCWLLSNLRDDIDISWVSSGSQDSKTVTITNAPYLLFKLHGEYLDYGRHVRQLRRAAPILIILSNDWAIADDCKNIVGQGEPVAFDGYTAHYINSIDDTQDHITIANISGDVRELALDRPVFLLEGNRVRNDDRNSCPIFGGDLPEIRISMGSAWTDIATVLIGEEGPGRRKWHGKFLPIIDKPVQQIPHTVAGVEIRNGWYYLRFYNQDYNFIDSLDFKYIAPLNKITTLGSIFPREQAHTSEEIQFHHNADCKIISKSHPEHLIPQRTHYGTVVRVPPQVCYDDTKWAIVDSSIREYDVTIELDRIWWALGYESILPQSWTDKLLETSLDHFKATSERCLWVKMPPIEEHTKSREINAGFSNLSTYAFKPDGKTCHIPLRIFGDSIFNHNEVGRYDFTLNYGLHTCPVLTLKIKGKCSFCGYETDDENGMLAHFRMMHEAVVCEDSVYKQLTYAEIRTIKKYSHMPSAVYKCSYCDHCVDADDRSQNPTSTILRHFESDNQDVCKAAKASITGLRVPTFGVMTDVTAINTIMNKNLPIIFRCTVCRRDIYESEGNSKKNRLEHVIQKHKNKLYALI